MLIKQETVIAALAAASLTCKGVLHVGAHECEELGFYQHLGIAKENCVWLDAVQSKVDQAAARGIPNVFKAVVTDKDDDTVTFRLTNNVQSSSVLEFGTHAKHHPHVHFVSETQESTVTHSSRSPAFGSATCQPSHPASVDPLDHPSSRYQ